MVHETPQISELPKQKIEPLKAAAHAADIRTCSTCSGDQKVQPSEGYAQSDSLADVDSAHSHALA